MKRYRILSILITVALVFIVSSCGDSGDSGTVKTPGTITPINAEEVNLLGNWNYTLTITDSECTGFVANGILDFQSMNGDLTVIGDVLIQGEGFLIANGICNLVPINITNTEWSGRPAVQSVSEFLTFKQLDLLGTGQTVRYDAFTSTRIVEVTTLLDGEVGTFTWTR
jgi:hypothetical protein